MSSNPRDFTQFLVEDEAERQGVDPNFAVRVAKQESGFNHRAVSPKGARGVMQLMPGTAKQLGVNPNDPVDNIRGGVQYLKQQVDEFGNPKLAAAAYNAGPGRVRRAGGVPNIPETQNYVANVAGDDQEGDFTSFLKESASPEPSPVPVATPKPKPAPPVDRLTSLMRTPMTSAQRKGLANVKPLQVQTSGLTPEESAAAQQQREAQQRAILVGPTPNYRTMGRAPITPTSREFVAPTAEEWHRGQLAKPNAEQTASRRAGARAVTSTVLGALTGLSPETVEQVVPQAATEALPDFGGAAMSATGAAIKGAPDILRKTVLGQALRIPAVGRAVDQAAAVPGDYLQQAGQVMQGELGAPEGMAKSIASGAGATVPLLASGGNPGVAAAMTYAQSRGQGKSEYDSEKDAAVAAATFGFMNKAMPIVNRLVPGQGLAPQATRLAGRGLVNTLAGPAVQTGAQVLQGQGLPTGAQLGQEIAAGAPLGFAFGAMGEGPTPREGGPGFRRRIESEVMNPARARAQYEAQRAAQEGTAAPPIQPTDAGIEAAINRGLGAPQAARLIKGARPAVEPAAGQQAAPAVVEPPIPQTEGPQGGAIVGETPAVPNRPGAPISEQRFVTERANRRAAERRADTDPMTGLESQGAWNRAQPAIDADPNRAVIRIDLNNFKVVNDKEGHPVGNKVLADYAAELKKAVPEAQMVARSGGDEMSVVLPPDAAPDAVERIKQIEVQSAGGRKVNGSVGWGMTDESADAASGKHKAELKAANVIGERGQEAPETLPSPAAPAYNAPNAVQRQTRGRRLPGVPAELTRGGVAPGRPQPTGPGVAGEPTAAPGSAGRVAEVPAGERPATVEAPPEHHSEVQPRSPEGQFAGPPDETYVPKAEREAEPSAPPDIRKLPAVHDTLAAHGMEGARLHEALVNAGFNFKDPFTAVAGVRAMKMAQREQPTVAADYGKAGEKYYVLGRFPGNEKLLVIERNGTPHIIQNPHGEQGNTRVRNLDPDQLAKVPDVRWEEIGQQGDAHPTMAEIRRADPNARRLSDLSDETAKEHFPEVYKRRQEAQAAVGELAADAILNAPYTKTDKAPEFVKRAQEALAKPSEPGGPESGRARALEDLSNAAVVYGWKAYQGIKDFGAWAREMVKGFGERIRPTLRALYDGVRSGGDRIQAFYQKHIEAVPGGRPSERGFIRIGSDGEPQTAREAFDAITEDEPPRGSQGAPLPRHGPGEAYYEQPPEQPRRTMTQQFRDMTPMQRFAEIPNLAKSLKASLDLSAPGRQGIFDVMAHPFLSARAAGKMLQAVKANPQQYQAMNRELQAHPRYEQARQHGLEFTDVTHGHTPISQREESFHSQLAGKIPGVTRSNQAYASFLNWQRLLKFDNIASLAEAAHIPPNRMNRVLDDAAKLANISTGRGIIPRSIEGTPLHSLLNGLTWSPKFVASRFELLNQMFNPKAYKNLDPFTRRQMAQDTVKFIGGLATVMGIAKALGARVGTDPDDSDFGKIVAGNTRYDLTGGLSSTARFMYGMTQTAYKRLSGDKIPEGKTEIDRFLKFARGKASPVPSTVLDFYTGKDYKGSPVPRTPTEVAKRVGSWLVPMVFEDMVDGIKQDGAMGGVKSLPTIAGIGTQTYEKVAPPSGDRQTVKEAVRAANPLPEPTPLKRVELDAKSEITRAIQARAEGKMTPQQVQEVVQKHLKAGTITEDELFDVASGAMKTGEQKMIEGFKKLPLEAKIDTYSKLSPAGRKQVEEELMDAWAEQAPKLPPAAMKELGQRLGAAMRR